MAATTTPSTVATDFTDILSNELLLQPDPEFVFARWAFSAAVQDSNALEEGFDLALQNLRFGRTGEQGVDGGIDRAMSSGMGGPLEVSNGMLYPDMFRMVAEAKESGEVIKIDRPRFIDGGTTESSRRLRPDQAMFTAAAQVITMDQVAVTIVEYGGPGDASGTISVISLAEFTKDRARHNLLRNVTFQLRRDRFKFVDDLVQTRLFAAASANDKGASSGSSITRGGNPQVTTNAGFTGVGNEPFSFDLLPRSAEQLKGRYVPGIALGARYLAILDQHQYADLMLDPMYQRLSVYEPNLNPLFPGYKRTVDSFIICESNRMQRLTNLGASANIPGYQAIIMAPGVLGWASGSPCRARRDLNDDGGRFHRYGWTAIEGWQVLDDRFVQVIITD